MIDKPRIVNAILVSLREQLAAVEDVARMAQDEVGSDESKSEGPYDTRATEASYLARGQAERVLALRRLVDWFAQIDPNQAVTKVGLGACVEVFGRRRQVVFIAPEAGPNVELNGMVVGVISPSSPLGSAMEELEAGDAFEVDSPTGVVEYEVYNVR